MMMIISLFRRDVYITTLQKFNQLISTVDIFNYEMFLSTVIIYSTTKCSFQMRLSTVVIYSTGSGYIQMFISKANRHVEWHVEDSSATPASL